MWINVNLIPLMITVRSSGKTRWNDEKNEK